MRPSVSYVKSDLKSFVDAGSGLALSFNVIAAYYRLNRLQNILRQGIPALSPPGKWPYNYPALPVVGTNRRLRVSQIDQYVSFVKAAFEGHVDDHAAEITFSWCVIMTTLIDQNSRTYTVLYRIDNRNSFIFI